MSKTKSAGVDHYLLEGCGRCPLGGTPECKVHNWEEELSYLRSIMLECNVVEEIKWGVPCYTYDGANLFILSAFKDYCSISFFKGALLKDTSDILVKQGENTQAARLLKFTDISSITKLEADIKAYIQEAIDVEKAGLKYEYKQNPEPMPAELKERLDDDPSFKNAFYALTPGRQRSYIIYIGQAKQSKTRYARVEKCMPKVFLGKGWNEY